MEVSEPPADDVPAPEAAPALPAAPAVSVSVVRWAWEWAKAISTAVLLFLCVRTFVVEAFTIPTGSMERTLLVGDFLLVNKAVYGAEVPATHLHLPAFRQPSRGDVVVFLPPHDPERNYVKRIVGVGGDTLEMRHKLLFRNGTEVEEPYVRHTELDADREDPQMLWQRAYAAVVPGRRRRYPSRDNWGPIVVPAGKYFALGDNRDFSEDSRYWGFLDKSAIKGRPMFVYYSFQTDPTVRLRWLTAVRWDRIGNAIQ